MPILIAAVETTGTVGDHPDLTTSVDRMRGRGTIATKTISVALIATSKRLGRDTDHERREKTEEM